MISLEFQIYPDVHSGKLCFLKMADIRCVGFVFYYYSEDMMTYVYNKTDIWLSIVYVGLGKDFSLKLTILLHDLHIEILTFVEYNLYA